MATITQQRKKQQRMLLALGFVVFLIAAVLFWGLSGRGNKLESLPQDDIISNIENEAAKAIMRDISIPRDFFNNKILQQFSSYKPISAPAQSGRDNPFAPSQ